MTTLATDDDTNHAEVKIPEGIMAEHLPEVSKRLLFTGHVPKDEDMPALVELGHGLRLLSERRGELTHEMADKVLMWTEFIVNDQHVDRNLRNHHVEYLIAHAKRGTFHPEWVEIMSCLCKEPFPFNEDKLIPAGTEIRMNGQHTCWMRLAMPEDWPCPVRFFRYEADTVADMRRLYASIDRNGVRGNTNVLDSYLAGTEQFKGINQKVMQSVAGGLGFWLWGDNARRHDADEIAYLVQTEHQQIAAVVTAYLNQCYKGKDFGCFRRAAVVAAMYETFQKVVTKAHEFWDPVTTGVSFVSIHDPRKKLHDLLREAVIPSARAARPDKKLVTSEAIYRQAIHCWNAWRRGEELQILRAPLKGKRPRAK